METDDGIMSQKLDIQSVSEFMWREAEILDNRQYQEWLNLWEADGLYFVPIERDVDDYANVLNFAYDNAAMRKMRVARLTSRFSMSATASSTTVRTTSRFVVKEQNENEMTIRAAQHLADYRRDNLQMIAADIEAVLRLTPDGLKYVKKIVRLANSDDAVSGFAYLL